MGKAAHENLPHHITHSFKLMKIFLFLTVICLGFIPVSGQDSKFLTGEYWRKQALEDVLPHWTEKGVDKANGMFFTNLDRMWQPFGSFDQSPAMIARHLFAFSAGYLMSGDEKLISRAQSLLHYLNENAWDEQHGGWYDLIDRQGNPVKLTKTTFNQVYCITGLTLYYFVTRDKKVLKTIERANALLERKVWDTKLGGYYDVMNRDWTVHSNGKSFSSEITPVSGYLFYLYLATKEAKYLHQLRRVMNVVGKKMTDPATGWILESFDNSWKYNYPVRGTGEVNIGHNIETAWMLLRLYRLTGENKYLTQAKQLGENIERFGYYKDKGCWYANVSRENPELHSDLSYWWIQAYGNMYHLFWYSIDRKNARLAYFQKGASFWDKYFIDKSAGDAFQGVSVSGEPKDPVKANLFKASYHNLENSLLCWLYLGLWVEEKEIKLYFSISEDSDRLLFPLPVEETSYQLTGIKVNGIQKARTTDKHVRLPAGAGKVEIVIKPAAPKK